MALVDDIGDAVVAGIAAAGLDSVVVAVSPGSFAVADSSVGCTSVRVAVHSVYEGRKYHLVPVTDW